MRAIRRQRETFCYRIAEVDEKKKKPFSLNPLDSKQDLSTQVKGWNPDEFNNVAEPTGNRVQKMDVTQGMGRPGQGGSGGGGSNTARPGNSGGSIRPETQSTLNWINQTYPQFDNIGGWRQPDGYNEHSSGSALDVMLPKGYDTSQSGAFIKDVFKNNPSAQYVLYDNQQWNPDGSSSYGISSPHLDHFHIRTVQ